MNETFYRAFSLTWPASMQIYENKKKFFAEHQYGRRFGRRDVMWKRSILSG